MLDLTNTHKNNVGLGYISASEWNTYCTDT